MPDGGGDATFDVSLEVRPLGFVEGVERTSTATAGLTASTEAYGAASRRTRTASEELALAEGRRLQTAAALLQSYTAQVAGLQAVTGASASLAGAVTQTDAALASETLAQTASVKKAQEKAGILAYVRGEYATLAEAMAVSAAAVTAETVATAASNAKLAEKAAIMAYVSGQYETLAAARAAATLAAQGEAVAATAAAGAEGAAGAAGVAAGAGATAAAGGADVAAASFGRLKLVLAGAFAGLFVLAAGVVLLREGVKYGEEAEKVYAQTRAVILSTGGAAGFTAQQIAGMARTLGAQAAVDNLEVQKQINYLLTFRQISGAVLPEATRMVLALSRGMSENLRSASIQVGKALEDPIRGVTALRRIGVEFSDGQRELIKHLVQTGDVLSAQKLILRELEIEVGKSGSMYAQTFAGQVDLGKAALREFARGIGAEVLPALTDMLRDLLGTADGSTTLSEKASKAGHVIGEYLSSSVYYAAAAFHGLAAVVALVFGGIITGAAVMVDGVLAAFGLLDRGLSHIPGAIGERYAAAAKSIQSLRDGEVRDLKTVGSAWLQTSKDQTTAAANAVEAAGHHKAAIDDVVTGLGKENNELAKVKKGMENARLEIEKQIALAAVQVADAQRLAAATLQGGAAVRQANVDASVAKTLEEDAQRLHKTGIPLLQARAEVERTWGQQIRDNAEGLARANQTLAVNGQLFASEQQTQSERLLGWAKLADATGGVTTNTAQLSAVLAVYADAERNGLPITDHRIQQLKDEALARVDLQAQVATAVQMAQDNLAFQQEEAAAEAEYQDALTRTTDASREANLQKQILVSLKNKNITAGTLEARVEEDTIRNHQRDVDASKALAAAEKLRWDALLAYQKKQAEYADLTAVRRSNEAVGTAITGVLEKYGLLSRAVDDLQIKEEAWQIFTTAGNTRTLAEINAELQARRQESRLLDENASAYEIYRIKVDESLDALASAFDILSQGFGGASTAMGKLAADMGKLVTAIKAVGDAQGRTNKILASAQVVAGIGAALADLNVGGAGKTGGPQALGGRLDSNYGGIGALVGTIIGAIIGAYFSQPAAGAALGGAIGTILGSLISKAGDSASATLLAGGNIQVNESSRQLNGAVKDALTNIFKGLQLEMAKLGLWLQGIPFIDIKVRDNIVRVIVGDVVRTFSSMQDAISFGISEALKQSAGGAGGHLPPEVVAALAHTTATDLQSLQSDIDFAYSIANYGVPKVAQALDKAISDFFVELQRDAELGIDSTKSIAKLADTIKAQKDSILGINRNLSPADQLRADVKAFNQKVELLRAEQQADLADLEGKKADLVAKIAIAKASLVVGREYAIAMGETISAMEAALGQMDIAITAAQAVLDALVTISDAELQAALARLGKGGKGAGAGAGGDALGSLKTMIDDVAKSVRQSGMTDLQKQLDDVDEKWKKAIGDVHLHSNAAEAAAKERDAALRAAGKLDKEHAAAAIKAANERYAAEMAGIGRTAAALAAANAARQQEIDLLKKDLDARVKTFVSTGAPGAGVTSALAGIDDTARGLIADARSLQTAGAMSVRQLHEMVMAINAATAAQRAAVKAGVLANVSDFLGGKGPTGLLGKLQQVSDTAKGLTADLGALADAGLLSAEALATLTGQITQSAAEQQAAAIQSSAQGLLSDLYGYLGMDKEAAQQKFDITVAELQARRAELEAALLTAKYTQAAMDNILGPIDKLIGKVVAAGPRLFEQGNSSDDGLTQAQRIAHDRAMFVNGQYVGEGGAGAAGGLSAADAQAQLQQFLDLGLSPMQVEINKVNDTFAKLRAALGNTADVQKAYALGMQDILNRYLQPVRDFLKGLNTSELSPLTAAQKFAASQGSFRGAVAAINSGDLSQLSQIGSLAQAYLQQAQAVLPTGSEAYRTIFKEVNSLLNAILSQYGGAAGGAGAQADIRGAGLGGPPAGQPGGNLLGSGPLQPLLVSSSGGGASSVTVNLQPVTEELSRGNAEQITELKKISKNTGDTRIQVERVADRMEQRWTLFRRAS